MQRNFVQVLDEPTFQLDRDHSYEQRVRRATNLVSRRRQWQFLLSMLLLNDILMAGTGFISATWIRLNLPLPVFNIEANPNIPSWQAVLVGFVPLWLVLFALQGLYQRQNLLGGLQEYAGVFKATSIGILIVLITGFLLPELVPARGWLLVAWLLVMVLVGGGRFLMRRFVYFLRGRGYFVFPTLIVGANSEGMSLAAQLMGWRTSGLYVLGFVDKNKELEGNPEQIGPILGNLKDLRRLTEELDIEELILATSALSQEEILSIFKRFGMKRGLNLRLSTGLFEMITTGLEVKELAYVPLMRVNQVRLAGMDRVLKFILDYSLAIPLAIVFLPVFAVLAILIKLDSPGPVFHRREVMGLNQSRFKAFKFRTMRIDGDQRLAAFPELQEELARNHKLKDDPRVTRLGATLRKFSLDELPQLINVLAGQMSLVGPRMISPPELAMYNKWDINLLTVRPGITGLWQVSGRSDVSYAERVNLDMHYIRNWTIWLDLQIIFQTIPAVIRSRGAY